ncbi:MAG: single-stranded-DNA-specific exonuclease C-terminal domain-containing protein, partial [Clostridia bacterium]|nr:single-stranded-DNA-specific exonuclease C-terminal domain-containing protein [Clostridia bacterium]
DGFDLRQALAYCGEFIEKFGGHEKAAGLTVKVANLRPFLDKLNEYYRDRKNETVQVKTQTVDCILPAWEITPENFESLRKLEPFGTDNEDPKICTNDVELCDIRYMSEGKHARFTFKALDAGGKPFIFTAKKFNIEGMPLPWPGERCSILYKADVNVWNGRKTAEPVIEDIFENAFCIENECKKIYNENCITHSGFYVKREDLVILFKVFRATGGRCDTQGINGLLKNIRDAGYGLTRYQIVYGLQIFRELGFVKLEKGVFETVPDAPSRSLEESEIFTSLSE